ncbi:MAG TPA: S53 family peptidase [Acidobacteriota bacterium]|nr:S53 family peptidase [Acidobacteriota bacterium]
MKIAHLRAKVVSTAILLAFSNEAGQSPLPGFSRPLPSTRRLYGHVPTRAIAAARWKGRLAPGQTVLMTVALPLRNQTELLILLSRLYDPADPLYGHYLSQREFAERFGPTQEDYDVIAGYMRSLGFKVSGTHPNRTLLDISGSSAAVEAGFRVQMHGYQAPDGREFHAPDNEPEFPDFIASRLIGVVGLENASARHSHSSFRRAKDATQRSPHQIGTGPGGGLTPNDIATAYNLSSISLDGSGQTLGLFELDGYNASDVQNYTSYYGLRQVTLQNVLVDGVSGNAGSGSSESTVDIELQIALAPGADRIIVYEGPNTNTGTLHTYNRIATDNIAKQISTSWGLSELESSPATMTAENAIFQQMAAQGQTIYAAAGDNGAYDGGGVLSVDDPASQPYVNGVGGTSLFVNPDGTYNHETTWNVNNTIKGGAGGGGISSFWSIPSWQQNILSVSSLGSATMRNVPDVSLNADTRAGYSIYYRGGWYIFGGTSCVPPLWAAFTALVNQQRLVNGMALLGFGNPSIYGVATGPRHATDFHDISDGSTNLYYPAVPGYDDATGWGSFNGANLLTDLAPSIRYYNVQGQPYTDEPFSFWQTSDGKWWMGEKSGRITPVSVPPWTVRSVTNHTNFPN